MAAHPSQSSARAAGPPPGSQPLYPRRWSAFAFLLLASAMNLIDLTIVVVGIPSIRANLGATAVTAEWIVAAYALVFGLGLITGGRLGDIYGRRPVFTIGVLGFTVGSALCGLAPTIWVLIAGRAIQAAFAAMMMPQVLSSLGTLFPPQERGRAMGMYGAVIGLATISGPLAGSLLVQGDLFGLHWRPIFLVNIPIGVVAAIGALRLVPDSRGGRPVRLDVVGVVLLAVALLLLLFPLVQGQSLGWPAWAIVSIVASVPAFALFAFHQSRRAVADSPLVPLSLFRQAGFRGGVIVITIFFLGLAGYSLVLMLTLQQGLGFGPIHAGLTVLPFSVGVAAASSATIRMHGRVPPRRLALLGILAITCGMTINAVVVHVVGPGLTSFHIIPGSLVSGLGLGTVTPVISGIVLSSMDPRDAGAGSGVLNTAGQVGSAVGVSIVGAIFFHTLPAGQAASHPAIAYTDGLGSVLLFMVPLYALCAVCAALLLPNPPPRPAGPPQPARTPAPSPEARPA